MLKSNSVRYEDFTYGPHDELISLTQLHNGRVVETETYTYIYSK
jgi:hypothetical protein